MVTKQRDEQCEVYTMWSTKFSYKIFKNSPSWFIDIPDELFGKKFLKV